MCPSGNPNPLHPALRILACAALTLACVAPVHADDALSKTERAALLHRLAEKQRENPGMTASFVETKTTRLLKEPLVTRGTIAFQAPDKFRREVEGTNASTSVTNGKTLWIYYPNFKEAERYELGKRDFFDDALAALTVGLSFDNVEQYYNLDAYRDGSGYRMALQPKSRKLRHVIEGLTIFMNADLKILRTVAELPKGDQLVTNYSDMQPRRVPASTFEFTPPPGVKVTQPMGK